MRRWLWYVVLGIALALVFRAESLFLGRGIDPDEGLALLQGRALCEGWLPYVKYFDHRQPLLYANLALAQTIFGERILSCRIWASLCVGMSAAFIGLIVHRLTQSRGVSVVAMATLAAFSMETTGITATSELLMMPWTVLAVLLALMAGERTGRGRWTLLVLSGLSIGIGAQVKLLAVFEMPAVLAAFWFHAARWRTPRLPLAYQSAALCAAAGVPFALIALVYAGAGHWHTFVHASFTFNRAYAAAVQFTWSALLDYGQTMVLTFGALTPLIVLAIVGWRWNRRATGFVLIWVGCCLVSACVTKRFFPHYLLTLLPVLSIIAGLGWMTARQLSPSRRRFAAAAICAGWLIVVYVRVDRLPALRAEQAESERLSQCIEDNSKPGDVIFLANNDPALYYVTRTEPATRFAFPMWIGRANWRDALRLDWERELRRVLSRQPRMVVLRHSRGGWDGKVIRWFESSLASNSYRVLRRTNDVRFYAPPDVESFVKR